ncbi:MAG TPA: hypothetical protein VF950_19530 [Planctomycetota bacterium]
MSAPAWYLDALREMKETRRGGVVLIVDAHYLSDLSQILQELVETDTRGLRALRRRAVLVLIPKALAKACLPDVEDGKTLVTLDADGKVLKAVEADAEETLRPDVFTRRVGRLLCKSDVGSDAPARALPYGVEWAEKSWGQLFGSRYDSCPKCGMAHAAKASTKMIKYLRLLGT